MKSSVLVFAVSVASVLGPATGVAATISVLGTNSSAWSQVDREKTTALGLDAMWTAAPATLPNEVFEVIDPCVSACSPFDPKVYGKGDIIDSSSLIGWQNLPFFAVWSGVENRATLQFSRPQTVLQLLWGSLDSTNLIEFFLGGTVAEVGGEDLKKLPFDLIKDPGQGAALIRISGLKFDRVQFSSKSGAFEMTNITSEVPLPPALLLLAGAFGLLGAVARRRRRA